MGAFVRVFLYLIANNMHEVTDYDFEEIGSLFVNVAALSDWRYWVMWAIGGLLIYLAIAKDMEPTLLLPLGFGTILVNIPLSGAIDQVGANGQVTEGALTTLFNAGIANELFPLILFIGIGAMIDFGPVLSNPKLMILARRRSLVSF